MNYIDIFLLVPLLWGAFKGFKKGLIIEVVSLIALGLGIWGGVHFSDFSTTFLADKLSIPRLCNNSSYLSFAFN